MKKVTYSKLAVLINETFGREKCVARPAEWYGGVRVIETNCIDDETDKEVSEFIKEYRTTSGIEFTRTSRNFKGDVKKWKEWNYLFPIF